MTELPHTIPTSSGDRCGLCTEPATHHVDADGWKGPACQRHAEHVQRVVPDAVVTWILVNCDVCGYAMADTDGRPVERCGNPVCGGGDDARARFAAGAVRLAEEKAERQRRADLLRLSFARS